MTDETHKEKVSRVVIFTSDAANAAVKQLKIRRWVFDVLVILFCVFVGGVIGFFIYEGKLWSRVQEVTAQKDVAMDDLRQENALLEEKNTLLKEEIAALTEKVEVLSDTVSQKVKEADGLQEQLDQLYLPTGFPLTGSATFEQKMDGDPICIFTGTENITVVATASGTVVSIEADETYGHKITVDHGNGYTTIYRNQGDTRVRVGDTVSRGTTLYMIVKDNVTLGYQMTKDGAYINPMDILEISG